MRLTKLAVAAAGLTFGLAACTSSGSPGAAPSGSAARDASGSAASAGGSGSTSGGGVANSCVAGTWKSTGVNMTFDAAGVHGSASGGAGVVVTVAPDGKVLVDFTGMQPVAFASTISGTEFKGKSGYSGKLNGTVQATPSSSTTGTWKPVGTVNWDTVLVTVDMQSPIQGRIFDNVRIADFAGSGGDQAGGSVDVQPILREATYECSGNTLKLGPAPGATFGTTWVLARA
jgi:hypothetical protein